MKIAYLELCGFRGYRSRIRIEFAEDFTILDGRNGVGKSTIFDAVEFALTGRLSKYRDAKADGESVADYIWWTGSGPAPEERFVEVGFRDQDGPLSIRRGEFGLVDSANAHMLAMRMCDRDLTPGEGIAQVCSSAIIRDEHIAGLSLDLKETDRYALLREGLGASDAERLVVRGAQLLASAKKRMQASQDEVAIASNELMVATRRVDGVRGKLVSDVVLAGAVERLRSFTKSEVSTDQLAGPVRLQIVRLGEEAHALGEVAQRIEAVERARERISELEEILKLAEVRKSETSGLIESLRRGARESNQAGVLVDQAKELIALANLGRRIGLRDGHCPLCSAKQTEGKYMLGVAAAEAFAAQLNQRAADDARRQEELVDAERRLAFEELSVTAAAASLSGANQLIQSFADFVAGRGLTDFATRKAIDTRIIQLRESIESAQRDMRVLATLAVDAELEQSLQEEARAKQRLSAAEERVGRSRRAEAFVQTLHDASRRAASETVDRRLDRMLPLMSELYRRLRPHPIWRDIEYSIRGDVRKFLKLQVGEEINPQFIFSRGQRRATGLAFLISVNLSLAWNRWRTIMLDDPVQHVDDFRTVHLAELAAQLVAEGRQIVCAVEDEALADLLCRRLPVRSPGSATRITMGPNEDGDLSVAVARSLPMLPRAALLSGDATQSQVGG